MSAAAPAQRLAYNEPTLLDTLAAWLLALLWLQMLGTFTPLLLFPEETFTRFPYAPTLEGQYIIKNIVLIAAGIVAGATVRGGRVEPEPAAAPDSLAQEP